MSQRGLNTAFAVKPMVELRPPVHRRRSPKVQQQELEGKLAALQRDYAELHAEIFEAAQVHRKLCAPRLVRYGKFEIASEIFAVRHLPGDFFMIRNTHDRTILALGDICGKGLAAGMWTTHMVELVGTRAAIHSEPESIVAGVNRDLCLTGSSVPLASLFVASLDDGEKQTNLAAAPEFHTLRHYRVPVAPNGSENLREVGPEIHTHRVALEFQGATLHAGRRGQIASVAVATGTERAHVADHQAAAGRCSMRVLPDRLGD